MNARFTTITQAFVEGLQAILGDKLHAAYIYGAAAFNDNFPTGDIDFHVILEDHLTAEEKVALEAMHADLDRAHPPHGADMDGYYILLEYAKGTTPPSSELWALTTDKAFALHREHIRGGRVITLVGGDPKDIYQPATWDELETALDEEIMFIRDHLTEYPDYCIMNLSRLIYTFRTRDVVVSKAKASEWAMKALTEWHDLIALARKSYQGLATDEDHDIMQAQVRAYLDFAMQEIDNHR